MSTTTAVRSRYTQDAVSTATPARLVIMLYDRLLRDLTSAVGSLQASDREGGSAALLHAQAIVSELNAALDTTAWDGAAGLSSLYVYIHERLVAANIAQDTSIVLECRDLLQPLRDAWMQAALTAVQPAAS